MDCNKCQKNEKKQMKQIDRESAIHAEDSSKWETTPAYYLRGRVMSEFFSKSRLLINRKNVTKGILGNYIVAP